MTNKTMLHLNNDINKKRKREKKILNQCKNHLLDKLKKENFQG